VLALRLREDSVSQTAIAECASHLFLIKILRDVGGGEKVCHFSGPVGAMPPLAGSGEIGDHGRYDRYRVIFC